ncbi:U3 snoRNP protein [Blyttiomyces sp. JEL0837]|nr:U3 snoRNP protein [Blyttiomyces sp. JEL0837]
MVDSPNPELVKLQKKAAAKVLKAQKKKAARKRKAANASASASVSKKLGGEEEDDDDNDGEEEDEDEDLEDLVFGVDVDGDAKIAAILERGTAFDGQDDDAVEGEDVPRDDEDIIRQQDERELAEGEDLFFIDRRKARIVDYEEGKEGDEDDEDDEEGGKRRKNQTAASEWVNEDVPLPWQDDDTDSVMIDLTQGANRLRKLRDTEDETTISLQEYERRLRRQFIKMHPTPDWARVRTDAERGAAIAADEMGMDIDPESAALGEVTTVAGAGLLTSSRATATLLRSARGLIDRSVKRRLAPESISMYRVRDANLASPSNGVIQACKFHPSAPILLTAALDKTVRLFHIDGKTNPKLQSVHFQDMPIFSADFTADGREIVLSGRRKHFYVYNLEKGVVERVQGIRGREEKSFEKHVASPCGRFLAFLGRDGYVILVSKQTKQWIANLKMNGSVRAIDFSKDGRFLYSIGSDGEVYQWDLATRQCVHRFYDEGAIHVNAISVSPDNSFIATGSNTGVVNVYNSSHALSNPRPTPSRSIMNLTTSISQLTFHPSSQALLLASRAKKDAMRIAHCPSLTVFPNWPTSGTPLSYVNAVDWSPGGGYLAVGNDKGRVVLYRANAFDAC